MKKLLLPTDFSDTAHNAFEYALHLADDLKAELTLLFVYPNLPLDWDYAVPPVADVLRADHAEDAMRAFDIYQLEAQANLGKQVPIELLLESGNPIEEIVRLSKTGDYDLIIMGTRGATSEVEQVFGSITASVIGQADTPVLAIPRSANYRPIRHLMYATTFRESDKGLMNTLMELAACFDAHISCVHVEASQKPWYEMEFQFVESLYQRRSHWHLLRFFHFNYPDSQEGLDKFIAETQVDIAAVLTHRKNILSSMLGHSFSRDRLLQTTVPLMVFPEVREPAEA